MSDCYEPVADGTADNVFIFKSYDATSHFETTCQDVLDIFKRGTGASDTISTGLRIRIVPDTEIAGYPANFAGYPAKYLI